MPRMSFRDWNSTLLGVGRRMSKMKLESVKINIWARDWKILRISLQINKFQYQNIRSRAQEIPKNELQESQNMFGSSRGPRQAKNKHWDIQNQHFQARPRKCQKWASGSAIRNVQISLGSIEKNIFEPCRAREKSKNNFADVPRWPSLGHARFRKCRNGQESLEMLEKCCFWHMLEEPGAESATKLSACQGLALQNMCKNVCFSQRFCWSTPTEKRKWAPEAPKWARWSRT